MSFEKFFNPSLACCKSWICILFLNDLPCLSSDVCLSYSYSLLNQFLNPYSQLHLHFRISRSSSIIIIFSFLKVLFWYFGEISFCYPFRQFWLFFFLYLFSHILYFLWSFFYFYLRARTIGKVEFWCNFLIICFNLFWIDRFNKSWFFGMTPCPNSIYGSFWLYLHILEVKKLMNQSAHFFDIGWNNWFVFNVDALLTRLIYIFFRRVDFILYDAWKHHSFNEFIFFFDIKSICQYLTWILNQWTYFRHNIELSIQTWLFFK